MNSLYSTEKIKEMLYEYRWRKNVLLDEGIELDSNSISQYGIESSMPNSKGKTSDKVQSIAIRNDVLQRILYEHIEVVNFVDRYEHCIENDKNLNVLYLLKKGKRPAEVKKIMNIGRSNYDSRISDIVNVYYKQQEKHEQHKKHEMQEKHKKQLKHNQH